MACKSTIRRLRIPILPLLAALMVLAASCSTNGNSDAVAQQSAAPDEYPGADLLVSPEWLAEHINDPDLRVVDLTAIGTYRDGHIPGAQHIWWQDTIEIHNEVYGMLAGQEVRSELIAETGIDDASTVVLYDDSGGRHAARFLWLLHAVGFERVALLHGGRQAWETAGFSLETGEPDHPAGDIDQTLNYDVLIGADDVQAAIEDPATVMVDGRSDEEREETWFGRLRVGQIPGSVHLPWDGTLQNEESPMHRAPDELAVMLPDALDPVAQPNVIVYGLHGVAAAHTYLTLRLLGFEQVRLYDGSWAEWGADPARPIEPIE